MATPRRCDNPCHTECDKEGVYGPGGVCFVQAETSPERSIFYIYSPKARLSNESFLSDSFAPRGRWSVVTAQVCSLLCINLCDLFIAFAARAILQSVCAVYAP